MGRRVIVEGGKKTWKKIPLLADALRIFLAEGVAEWD
jgi:hypothetical protein